MEVYGIASREVKRGPMLVHKEVLITPKHGVEGDSRCKVAKLHRKVTLSSLHQWEDANEELKDTNKEFKESLPWHARRSNICVTGVSFGPHHLGHIIYLLRDTEPIPLFEVTEELEPCHRMDEIVPGLQAALKREWRGGVACRVLCECVLREGDTLYFSDLPVIPTA